MFLPKESEMMRLNTQCQHTSRSIGCQGRQGATGRVVMGEGPDLLPVPDHLDLSDPSAYAFFSE